MTEMGFEGKIPQDHPNMRTEFAWMYALNADHRCIYSYAEVKGYEHVFIIFPKGKVFLSAEGSKLVNGINPASNLLSTGLIEYLKEYNKKVYIVQEGPHWWWNDYEMADQILYYNMLTSADAIFAHNEYDVKYYRGLFPGIPVYTIPSLMIDSLIEVPTVRREDKVIIGGNFARWYGGMESFMVAQYLEVPIWGQSSHARREGEEQLVHHLPRVLWKDWIEQLNTFKYAIHLMPTVAAGTFSLNCAYLGIPCIGNEKVDTQRICHPNLQVDVEDVEHAVALAKKLKNDTDFYLKCSIEAKENYRKYYREEVFKNKINNILKL